MTDVVDPASRDLQVPEQPPGLQLKLALKIHRASLLRVSVDYVEEAAFGHEPGQRQGLAAKSKNQSGTCLGCYLERGISAGGATEGAGPRPDEIRFWESGGGRGSRRRRRRRDVRSEWAVT